MYGKKKKKLVCTQSQQKRLLYLNYLLLINNFDTKGFVFWRTVKRKPGPTQNIRLWLVSSVSFPRKTKLRDGNGNR